MKDDPTGFCPEERAVTQPMPLADAVADAETLRQNVPVWSEQTLVRKEHEVHADLWLAGWQGSRSCVPSSEISTPDLAAACARIAAHAAFRAVPELRG